MPPAVVKTIRDEYWPRIIGFHTVPDYKQEVDYDNL